MNEDKIFELAEKLADEVYGNNASHLYSERQHLTVRLNEILLKDFESRWTPVVDLEAEAKECLLNHLHKVYPLFMTLEDIIPGKLELIIESHIDFARTILSRNESINPPKIETNETD